MNFGAIMLPTMVRRVEVPTQYSAGAGARRAQDRLCGDLGLIDRSHRLWLMCTMRARPVELRRVHRRQFQDRDRDRGMLMLEFGAQRGGEAPDRMLGAAIGRLQWNAAIGER